jgi:hypothetical protein
MSNPNRLRVWYPFRCCRCQRQQLRGSRARTCNLKIDGKSCRGLLRQESHRPRTLLKIAE